MSYSLDYLLFQMCPRFEFSVRRTNTSNQWHTGHSQHPGAFDSAQHLILSLCSLHKWTFLPSLLCDSTWSTGREVKGALTMMGLSQRHTETLFSPRSVVVSFWIINLLKEQLQHPKLFVTLHSFSFLTCGKLVSSPRFLGTCSPQQSNRIILNTLGHQWQQWGAKFHSLWDISHLISAFWVFTSPGFEFVIKSPDGGHKNGSWLCSRFKVEFFVSLYNKTHFSLNKTQLFALIA